ncbi:MAG: MFS transporter [Planctomycetaceae bacterium]|jgi:nucleoside transporter|nr:MFS transporter [Planctomycetaceae bacterium]
MSKSKSKSVAFVYPRLCIAYFLQFAIWGSWAGALGGYAGRILEMPGWQIGWLYAAIPLGAVISPLFIGPIADRYFAAQKVVALLHFIGSLCLFACGALCITGNQSFAVLMTLILLSGVCFMPTIALVNSIVFKHSKEGSAPYVFVFGTIGWIVVNLFIAAFLGGADQPHFFFAGGGAGLLLALYSLTLPDTPPKGASAAGGSDALGLGALKLFKDFGFAFFVFCAFLASIPACNFFFPFQETYLNQHGYPSPLALTTLNQFSELFFMSLLPVAIGVIGLRWVLVLGIGAWSLRYFVFMVPTFEFAVIGLLLHGFCYSFLYVAAYMYADKKAPAELKASVQSLMAFLLLGVGQVLGSQLYGYMRDLPQNAPKIAGISVVRPLNEDEFKRYTNKFVLPDGTPENFWSNVKINDTVAMPQWNDITMVDSAWRYLDLGKTVTDFMNKNKVQENELASDLGSLLDTNKDNKISSTELAAAPEFLKIGSTEYSKTDLEKTFQKIAKETEKIAGKTEGGDFEVARNDYLAVQAYYWKGILKVPAIFIAVFFVLFLLFGKDPDKGKKTADNR